MPPKKQASTTRISVNIHDIVSLGLVAVPTAVSALLGRTGGMDEHEALGVFKEISYILLRCEEAVAEKNPLPIIALLQLLNEAFGKSHQAEAYGKMSFEEDTALLLSLERIFTSIVVHNQLEEPPFIDSVTAAAQARHFTLLAETPQAVAVAELLHVFSVITTIPSIRNNCGKFLIKPIKDALIVHLYNNFITSVASQSSFTAICFKQEGTCSLSNDVMSTGNKTYQQKKSVNHFIPDLNITAHKQGPKVNLNLLKVDLPEDYNKKNRYPQLTTNGTRFIMTIFINLIRASDDNHLFLKWLFLPNAIGMSCDFFFQLQCLELMYRLNRKAHSYQNTWSVPCEGWLCEDSPKGTNTAVVLDDAILPTGSSSSKKGGNGKKLKSIAGTSPIGSTKSSSGNDYVCAFESVGRTVVEQIHKLKPKASLLSDMVGILEQCHAYGVGIATSQGKMLRPILSYITKRVEVAGEELDQGNSAPWKVYFCHEHFIIMMGCATVDQICVPYSFLRSASVTKSNCVNFRLYMAPTRVRGMMDIESGEDGKDRISIEMSTSNIYKFRKSVIQSWIMNAMTRRKEASSNAKNSREVAELDQNYGKGNQSVCDDIGLQISNGSDGFLSNGPPDRKCTDDNESKGEHHSNVITVNHQTPDVSDACYNKLHLNTHRSPVPLLESAAVRLNFDNTCERVPDSRIEKSYGDVVGSMEKCADENQRLLDRIVELENSLAAARAAAKLPLTDIQMYFKSTSGMKRSRSPTTELTTSSLTCVDIGNKPFSEDETLKTALRSLISFPSQYSSSSFVNTSTPIHGALRTELLINNALDHDSESVVGGVTHPKINCSSHDNVLFSTPFSPVTRSRTKERSIEKDLEENDTGEILLVKEGPTMGCNKHEALSQETKGLDRECSLREVDKCDSLSLSKNNISEKHQKNGTKQTTTLRAALALKALIDEKLLRKKAAVQQRLQKSMSVLQNMVDLSRKEVYKNIISFEMDVTEGLEAAAGAEAAVRKTLAKSLCSLNERVDTIERWSNGELRNSITCTEISAFQALDDCAEAERSHLKTIKTMVDASMRKLQEHENERAMHQDPLQRLNDFLSS